MISIEPATTSGCGAVTSGIVETISTSMGRTFAGVRMTSIFVAGKIVVIVTPSTEAETAGIKANAMEVKGVLPTGSRFKSPWGG